MGAVGEVGSREVLPPKVTEYPAVESVIRAPNGC